jgi:1-acyl-sn-glycerol-3-phosphate acyltransferase
MTNTKNGKSGALAPVSSDSPICKILSYPRSILGALFALIFTGAYSAFGVTVSFFLKLDRARRFQNWVIYTWSKILLGTFAVDLHVAGRENLTAEGVLFVFNHTSLFDIPVFHAAITGKTVRFGAKIELYKIPFFSAAMRKFGALPIARSDRDKVLKLYQDSIARVHQGESFVLAAEGGRHSGDGVGERLKSGPFIFAINGQFPIQPVVIKGASKLLANRALLPSWGRWRNSISLTVLPIVPTRGLGVDDRETLKASVYEMMTKAYAQS